MNENSTNAGVYLYTFLKPAPVQSIKNYGGTTKGALVKANANIILIYCRRAITSLICLLCLTQMVFAQTGYLYVHTKALSEDVNQSFSFSVSGGSTSVSGFTVLDQALNIEPTDIGAGHGTGGGELWVVAGATQGASGTIYHRGVKSTIWNTVSGHTGSAIDGADLGHFLIIDGSGDAYVYNGTSFIKIFDHSTYGVKAVDIANSGSITSGTGFTAIVCADGHVKAYTGNYSTTFTWTDITPVDKSGGSFKRLDINHTNKNIVLADQNGYVTEVNSAGGGLAYYSRGTSSGSGNVDIAIDDNGMIYGMSKDAQGMDAVYRYNGSSWTEEPETGLHYFLTCSDASQVWVIKGQTAAQSSSFANQSTIYTRVGDGSATWLDDERVQTSQNGNSIIIPVSAGTYTVTEASPSNWNLQKIEIYDSTPGSTTNVAGNSATVVVSAGQVVHLLYTNGIVAPVEVPLTCGTTNIIQDFGSGAPKTRGGPLTGLTDFHYYSNSSLNTTPDGYYSLTQNSQQWGNNTLTDHSGLTGGYFLMVNAAYAPNEFFRKRITGLIPGGSYTFSFWAANLSPSSPLIPNILFGIADTASGATLGSVSASLPIDNLWHQYTFSFVARATTGDVFLQNNAPGGFGNDLAIDDIGFTQFCSVLPLTLGSFNVVKQNNTSLLNWAIISNPGLDYFDVERSTDKGATWKRIGMVPAAGGYAMTQNYSFTDANPEIGVNLYRLKMTDKNGSISYSDIKSVTIINENVVTITLFPNPVAAHKNLSVQLKGFTTGIYRINLVSSVGQIIKQITYNKINTSSDLITIPTAEIPGGIYVVTVNGNVQHFSKSIVIEN